mmetsp:Transcript_85092/g.190180  ORF Transcript_85092/g.190180 Transcript_85092/m.190180 type:complete len:212 (+) Transcript_85092:1184-1819(+)
MFKLVATAVWSAATKPASVSGVVVARSAPSVTVMATTKLSLYVLSMRRSLNLREVLSVTLHLLVGMLPQRVSRMELSNPVFCCAVGAEGKSKPEFSVTSMETWVVAVLRAASELFCTVVMASVRVCKVALTVSFDTCDTWIGTRAVATVALTGTTKGVTEAGWLAWCGMHLPVWKSGRHMHPTAGVHAVGFSTYWVQLEMLPPSYSKSCAW